MRRVVVPVMLLVCVTAGTFVLASWHPFTPESTAAAEAGGDVTRGEKVFTVNCAGCHGLDASGGVGPSLVASGLTAAEVASVVAEGRGVMPAGLVDGQEAADVAAYVATLSE